MKDSEYLKVVAKEWRAFRDGATLGPVPTVRKLILDSWRRSRDALGVKDPASALPLRGEELARKLEANRELIASARPVMEQYRALLQSMHSVFVLAAADGVILDRHGAPDVIARMGRLNIGVLATEDSDGTNGISLCIRERRPVEIFGPEHYNARDHDWCCASAPLWDRNDSFVGVLTVILPLEEFHSHTAGMLTAAASNINARHEARDLLGDQQALFELCGGCVLVLDPRGGIKSASKNAQTILGLPRPPLPPGNIRDVVRNSDIFETLLKTRRNISAREVVLELETGRLRCELSSAAAPGGSIAVRIMPGDVRGRKRPYKEPPVEDPAKDSHDRALYGFDDIMGSSPALRRSLELARIAAGEDITALLLGESGTGKELFAHAIHSGGPRKNRPFIIVNCGAIPRELVQSELFGYAPGAFTGAAREGRPGKFELADGGTLFLDEIGEMPPDAQTSLLRLIQNGEVSRIGGRAAKRADVRIIAASNRDLRQAVREGAFRADLFHRLNVFPVRIPPLRDRTGDIPVLARHFLRNLSRGRAGTRQGGKFSPSVLALLESHSWPGNVRELENLIRRVALLAFSPAGHGAPSGKEGCIQADLVAACLDDSLDFLISPGGPAPTAAPPRVSRGGITTEQSPPEQETLRALLLRHEGNIRAAAGALGISRSALYGRLARAGLDPAAFRGR